MDQGGHGCAGWIVRPGQEGICSGMALHWHMPGLGCGENKDQT